MPDDFEGGNSTNAPGTWHVSEADASFSVIDCKPELGNGAHAGCFVAEMEATADSGRDCWYDNVPFTSSSASNADPEPLGLREYDSFVISLGAWAVVDDGAVVDIRFE
ncbi:MAG: hypothetical protein ACOC2Y_09770 [Spirochaetota bacterium]